MLRTLANDVDLQVDGAGRGRAVAPKYNVHLGRRGIADVWITLNHPSVVPLCDAGEDGRFGGDGQCQNLVLLAAAGDGNGKLAEGLEQSTSPVEQKPAAGRGRGYRRLRHVKHDLAEARLIAHSLSLGMHHNLPVGVGGEVDAPLADVGFERAHARLEGTHALGQVPYLGASPGAGGGGEPVERHDHHPSVAGDDEAVHVRRGYRMLRTKNQPLVSALSLA